MGGVIPKTYVGLYTFYDIIGSTHNCLHYALALTPVPPPVWKAWPTSPGSASWPPPMRSSVSTRIGCTKITLLTWMAGSMSIISGKLGGKTCLFANPTLRHMVFTGREIFFLNLRRRAWRHTILEMERRVGDFFSGGYPATRMTRYWHQKYSRTN